MCRVGKNIYSREFFHIFNRDAIFASMLASFADAKTMIEFQWHVQKNKRAKSKAACETDRLKYCDTRHCHAAQIGNSSELISHCDLSLVRRYIRCLTHKFEIPHLPIRNNHFDIPASIKVLRSSIY